MGRGHHHHHGVDPAAGDRRVALAVLVNLALTAAQVAGGLLAGSLALVADALHNLSDAMSLVIAFLARRIARRPATQDMTFGYGRAEPIAALVNYTALIIVALYLGTEAVGRLLAPQKVDGWLVVAVAGFALVVDVITAALTFSMARTSMNIRAAFLHNVSDALGSLAVIAGGVLIALYDLRLVDPLLTLAIAGYILWLAATQIGGVIRLLMLASPPGIEPPAVVAAVREVDGVADVHHAHLWQMQEHEPALDAHVVIAEGRWDEADGVKVRIKDLLSARFGIDHATIEVECHRHECVDQRVFGHG